MLAEDFQKAIGQAISEYYTANRESGVLAMPDQPEIVICGEHECTVNFSADNNRIEIVPLLSLQSCISNWDICDLGRFSDLLSSLDKTDAVSESINLMLRLSSLWLAYRDRESQDQKSNGRVITVEYCDGKLVSLFVEYEHEEVAAWRM